MKRFILRTLWTWSVLLSGESRLTVWLERRYESAIFSDWGCL